MKKKVVVITGAASGIGKCLVAGYIKRDFKVCAIDLNVERLNEMKVEHGDDIQVFPVDVTDLEGLKKIGSEIKNTWGKPRVWINSAGIAKAGKFEDISEHDFKKVFDVLYWGVVNGTRVALELMQRPERGTIVNISSASDTVIAPFLTSYVSAKHAVAGFTRSLSLEKRQQGSALSVVLVSPGFVKTEIMNQEGFEFPKWLEFLVESPKAVANEIITSIEAGKLEIRPTLNGKLMLGLNRLSPELAKKSSRLLTAKNWKEAIGLSNIKK